MNNKLIDLLTMTLGFRSKHNYSTKQLVALCSIFPTILKNKGNIEGEDNELLKEDKKTFFYLYYQRSRAPRQRSSNAPQMGEAPWC